jgi:hypothetical protein
MRFNILVAASFLVTFAAGLAIPADLSSRDLEVRDGPVEDAAEVLAREPAGFLKKKKVNTFKPKYTVPAGGGKPARAFI